MWLFVVPCRIIGNDRYFAIKNNHLTNLMCVIEGTQIILGFMHVTAALIELAFAFIQLFLVEQQKRRYVLIEAVEQVAQSGFVEKEF